MKANEIAARLALQAESVASTLLPGGKRKGGEWEVGGLDGTEGKSLKIRLAGEKAGVWNDFAGDGPGGDLLDLWARVNRQDMKTAMKDAQRWLGVTDTQSHLTTPLSPAEKSEAVLWPSYEKPYGEVLKWLSVDRGLTEETLDQLRIVQVSKTEILFPYLNDQGDLIFGKVRDVFDKKKMRVLGNSTVCLMGWHAIPADTREVVITEGEVDMASWHQLGHPCLSVPTGAKGLSWIESEFESLERFDKIYIAFDMDEAGQEGAMLVINRLGGDRCWLVDTGDYEDINLLLQSASMVDAEREAKSFIDNAKSIDPVELRQAAKYVKEVKEMFLLGEDGQALDPGFDTPFPSARGDLRSRWHELTVLTGINGHGKSQYVMQAVLEAISRGERACIYSGEMPIRRLLQRGVIQASCEKQPNVPTIEKTMAWFRDKLWLFELTKTAKADRLLEVFEYAHRRYGISVFVIDSLLKCGLAEDDYDGQKMFVERLCDFKNEFPVHVFLIAHPRKGPNELAQPGKMDIRGGSAITDLADTVLVMWRNKIRELAIITANAKDEPVEEKYENMYHAILACEKQRNGEWEKSICLWWDVESFQFLDKPLGEPKRYARD